MLLIKTYLGRSKIHGIGVFAAKPIKKGTAIWKFQRGFDVTFTDREVKKLPRVAKQCVLHYAYFDQKMKAYILPSDDSRFFNHSKNPNVFSSLGSNYDTAARDIKKGEEITYDYSTFDYRHEFDELYKKPHRRRS